MEMWDLYDENRNKTGKYCIRGNDIPNNYYHLVVHVWIRNDKDEFLMSQRAANRPTYPLMWECPGGSVLKGEESIDGAIREVKEEVGIDLNRENGKVAYSELRKIHNGKKFNDIMDAWLFDYNGEVDLSRATTDEVCQVKWMNRKEIEKLFEEKKMVESLRYFFEKF